VHCESCGSSFLDKEVVSRDLYTWMIYYECDMCEHQGSKDVVIEEDMMSKVKDDEG